MNGPNIVTAAALGTVPNAWSLAQTGDYDGNGMSDLLWRHNLGNTAIWFMNGVIISTIGVVGNTPPVWKVQAANTE